MSCWEINSTILREQYPGLLDEILRNEAASVHTSVDTDVDTLVYTEDEPRIETAASGAPTLIVKGLYVHSARDPQREADRLARASLVQSNLVQGGKKPGPVILLGFGLGYMAEALASAATPRRPIIIVEKNINLLRIAFEQRDLSRLLRRPDIAFVPGGSGDGVITALSLFEKSAGEKSIPHIVRNGTLTGIDEQWYASVETRIRNWTMRDDVNQATLKKFGKRWVRNLSRNMSAIRDLPGISRLAGFAAPDAFGGQDELPVFLAAAGPSLDSIAPLLPEIHKRCVILAVDTSLRFMLRNGVEPDFVLVVDPQYWNNRHLDCINRKVTGTAFAAEMPEKVTVTTLGTILIAESAVYPPVLRLPFKERYLCGSLYPLGAFIEQRVDPKGALGAGGSVATAAWDFARVLGARHIWIAGLDLAFPGLKTHFKGAEFEGKALAESARLNPAETWLIHALRDGIPFKAAALGGGKVLTDRRLSLYATWFAESFRRFPGIRNYGLLPGDHTAGGLAIPGLEPAAAEAILALPEHRGEINRRLAAASSRVAVDFFNTETARQRAERYETAVATMVSQLEQIADACKQGEKIAAQALQRHLSQNRQAQILAALDEINRFITGSEVKDIAGFLFPQETLAEISNTGQTRDKTAAFHDFLAASARLYRSLAEAAAIPLPK